MAAPRTAVRGTIVISCGWNQDRAPVGLEGQTRPEPRRPAGGDEGLVQARGAFLIVANEVVPCEPHQTFAELDDGTFIRQPVSNCMDRV